jgi:hypothetical protein
MTAGNHDSEIANDRAEQMKYMQTLPYSLAEPGPKNVDGVGNCEYQTNSRTRLTALGSRLTTCTDAIKLFSQDA